MRNSIAAFTFGMVLCACGSEQPDVLNENDVTLVDFEYQIEGDCSTQVLEVVIENSTPGAKSYLWDFGDGTISSQVNPRKVYSKSGSYTIKLTAYFSGGLRQIEKQISIVRNSDGTGPVGQLSFQHNSDTDLEVIYEIKTQEPVYFLSFGDGTAIRSSEKMIRHQYAGVGVYSALLIVEDSAGCSCASTTVDLTL